MVHNTHRAYHVADSLESSTLLKQVACARSLIDNAYGALWNTSATKEARQTSH